MIFVIDSDAAMAGCIAKACGSKVEVKIFSNAIEAAQAMVGEDLPKMIFLEVMLNGPDGFSLLNELISYTDTAQVPVVIVSDLDFSGMDLSVYGVVAVLKKDAMRPRDVRELAEQFA